METFFKDYIERLQALHFDVIRELEGSTLETLNWVPGPGMNSLSVLVVHLTGAERYWIGDVAMGEPSGRDRAAEFLVKDIEFNTLKARLDDSVQYIRAALERLALQDLERVCVSPRDGHEFTVAWVLLYIQAHTALHLGHIQITRQLWEADHTSIDGG